LTNRSRAGGCAGFNYPFLTQKERAIETGLDFFEARYYASTQGRFTSVDPLNASGKPGIPQSWNRYTYCLNSPLILVDPTGMIWGTQDFEQDGHKYRRYVWFEGKKVGKGFTAFTPAKDGTVIGLKDGTAARIYGNGNREYIGAPAKITISGQENLNAAAGMFDGSIPLGRQIREAALGGPGGVDTDSAEYNNASTISEGVMQGSLFFAGGPLEGVGKEGAEGAAKLIEEAASKGARFGPDQDALIQLAKEAKAYRGNTRAG
jgi:RHS repeat-associated protein